MSVCLQSYRKLRFITNLLIIAVGSCYTLLYYDIMEAVLTDIIIWYKGDRIMNIIYAHTHDSGRYISPYGYQLPTPNLQKLAEEGTIFRSAYCAAPTCSPSRACLLTGMYAHSNGMLGLAHRGFSLNDPTQHMASYFSKNGIHTVLSGVQHESLNARELGYDEVITSSITKSNARDQANAQRAVEFIENWNGGPFFMAFGMHNTHRDYPVDESINPNYVIPPCTVADTPENRRDFSHYMNSVSIVDSCMGQVIEAVKARGIWDDTVIVFTTDHGLAMPGMKCTLFDTGVGISLVMAGGGIEKGGCRSNMISHVDLYPTFCELFGIPTPEWCCGTNAMPLIRSDEPIRDYVFAEVNYHATYQPMRMVRGRKFKLIKTYYDTSIKCYPNIDDCAPKDYLLASENFTKEMAGTMLFDLECDPMERQNLADDPSYRSVLDELEAKLQNWMKETNDPLLTSDHIPMPEGARINIMTGNSPKDTVYM